MSSQFFPTYSVNSNSVKIQLDSSNYATKTDLKSLNADTSSFALKTNLVDLETRVDEIDVNKINDIDALQGKNFVEESSLFFEPKHKYFETFGIHINNVSPWKSTGLSAEKIKPTKEESSPELFFKSENISLSFNRSVLAQEKSTYTHGSMVCVYIVYSLSNIAISTDSMAECLFGATSLSNKKYTRYGIYFSSNLSTQRFLQKCQKFNNFWCRFKQL